MDTRQRNPRFPVVAYALAAILSLSLINLSCTTGRQAQRQEALPKSEETKATEGARTAEKEDKQTTEEAVVCQPNEVSQPPQYLETPSPQYPDSARLSQVEATVVLALTVDEKGRVEKVEVISCTGGGKFKNQFRKEAISAARRYKFEPAMQDGKPVPCTAKVVVKFKLD